MRKSFIIAAVIGLVTLCIIFAILLLLVINQLGVQQSELVIDSEQAAPGNVQSSDDYHPIAEAEWSGYKIFFPSGTEASAVVESVLSVSTINIRDEREITSRTCRANWDDEQIPLPDEDDEVCNYVDLHYTEGETTLQIRMLDYHNYVLASGNGSRSLTSSPQILGPAGNRGEFIAWWNSETYVNMVDVYVDGEGNFYRQDGSLIGKTELIHMNGCLSESACFVLQHTVGNDSYEEISLFEHFLSSLEFVGAQSGYSYYVQNQDRYFYSSN